MNRTASHLAEHGLNPTPSPDFADFIAATYGITVAKWIAMPLAERLELEAEHLGLAR